MPAPFYNCIKGTTSGTPGTGAFTPNAASTGFRAWSTVPTGWIGLVRFEDGTDWELNWSYWNGTTLSRSATQFFDGSTGSHLTLTSSATAAMIADASEIMWNMGSTPWRLSIPAPGATTPSLVGIAHTASGTAAGANVATTSFFNEQQRLQYTSATTASAQAGISNSNAVAIYSTTAGRGGAQMVARYGALSVPTGPRLFAGFSSASFVGQTIEPSAFTAHIAAFAKDSTDTNIQLLTNSNAGSGTKIDTGIPFVAGSWYEASVWWEPAGGKIYGLLIRLDTGDIWFGSTTTDIPNAATTMVYQVIGSLNGSNTGTAIVMCVGAVAISCGF